MKSLSKINMSGGVFIDHATIRQGESAIINFIQNSTIKTISDTSIGAVVIKLTLNRGVASPFKKYISSSVNVEDVRALAIKLMPTRHRGARFEPGTGALIPANKIRRKLLPGGGVPYNGNFEECIERAFKEEVITHSEVYWNTLTTNGVYGFGESCTSALIYAHFPNRRVDPSLYNNIIQELRIRINGGNVEERVLGRLLNPSGPIDDKTALLNMLRTNPAFIIQECLEDVVPLSDMLSDRTLDRESKSRLILSVMFEVLKFNHYTNFYHQDLHSGNILVSMSGHESYWGRGVEQTEVSNDRGHDYPRAFVIDFGRITFIQHPIREDINYLYNHLIRNRFSRGVFPELLKDLTLGIDNNMIKSLLSAPDHEVGFKRLAKFRNLSSNNWCRFLFREIRGVETDSPLHIYRQRLLDPSKQGMNDIEKRNEIYTILLERINDLRINGPRRDSYFNLPSIEVLFLGRHYSGALQIDQPGFTRPLVNEIILPEEAARQEQARQAALQEQARQAPTPPALPPQAQVDSVAMMSLNPPYVGNDSEIARVLDAIEREARVRPPNLPFRAAPQGDVPGQPGRSAHPSLDEMLEQLGRPAPPSIGDVLGQPGRAAHPSLGQPGQPRGRRVSPSPRHARKAVERGLRRGGSKKSNGSMTVTNSNNKLNTKLNNTNSLDLFISNLYLANHINDILLDYQRQLNKNNTKRNTKLNTTNQSKNKTTKKRNTTNKRTNKTTTTKRNTTNKRRNKISTTTTNGSNTTKQRTNNTTAVTTKRNTTNKRTNNTTTRKPNIPSNYNTTNFPSTTVGGGSKKKLNRK